MLLHTGLVSCVNDKEDSKKFSALSNKAVKNSEYAHQSIPYSNSGGEARGDTRLQHLCPNPDDKASQVVQYFESLYYTSRRYLLSSLRPTSHTAHVIRHSGIQCVVQARHDPKIKALLDSRAAAAFRRPTRKGWFMY
jgi:hypothetical protein